MSLALSLLVYLPFAVELPPSEPPAAEPAPAPVEIKVLTVGALTFGDALEAELESSQPPPQPIAQEAWTAVCRAARRIHAVGAEGMAPPPAMRTGAWLLRQHSEVGSSILQGIGEVASREAAFRVAAPIASGGDGAGGTSDPVVPG